VTHDEHRPDRHLRPVHLDEPPDVDPYADNPPQPHDTRPEGRTPPHDVGAERALLGAMLISPAAIADLDGHIDGRDFYRPEHETIHTAITALAAAGKPVDMVTVADELAKTSAGSGRTVLDQVGGPLYLHDLAHGVPTAANATHYAAIVRDRARARTITTLGTRLTHLGHAAADPNSLDTALGEALQAVEDVALRYGPASTTPSARSTGLADLSWLLTGTIPTSTPPRWATRRDGTALFYAGRHNGLFGDPESGKTWLAQCAGIEALNAGETFAMIDVDHNGQEHTAARLALLGAAWTDLADPEKFRYYEPEDGDQLVAAVADITARAPSVVVIDSLGEVLPMLGVKSVDNDEITAALRTVVMPPAKAGSCVISVDHLPKSAEARSTGFAIGGTAKKRAVDGAYLRVDAKLKPAPGQVGRVMLRIEKDRTGELRKTSPGGYAGTFTLDSSSFDPSTPSDQQGAMRWWIGRDEMPRNDDGTTRRTSLMERVATYVGANENCTRNEIVDAMGGKKAHVVEAITRLVAEGHIARIPGANRTQHHTLLIPYREAEDDAAQQ
jgi:hypothetical protein